MNNRPEESIWGTINTCAEIALNIYMIVAVDEHGVEHNGIMAHRDALGKPLSEKAANLGEPKGDWLCFDENTKDVALYEVLKQRVEQCQQMEAAALREMKEIENGNRISLPEYFGDCPRPSEFEESKQVTEIRNGIYLETNGQQSRFAIHQSIAEHYLTPAAAGFGEEKGEYQYYSLEHCAVVLNELKAVFSEVERMIVSEESLYATLHQRFGEYVESYHRIVPEEAQIPRENVPGDLFLVLQLELILEAEKEKEESRTYGAEMEDFGEEVEYGVEP